MGNPRGATTGIHHDARETSLFWKFLRQVLVMLCFMPATILALVTPASHSSNSNNHNHHRHYSAENNKIRLVSWNLLAPVFCVPEKYSYCPKEYLDWTFRKQLILSELDRMDADIVCLQEVQVDLWDDFLNSFPATKYQGILQNVQRDHPVAAAVLLRKDKFRVLRQESRSRALILVIEQDCGQENSTGDPQQSQEHAGKSPLYLANVHLQAGFEDDETRICQLKSLLKRIHSHTTIERNAQEVTTPAVVVVGDFNMLPTNPVYKWLSHKEHETASSNSLAQKAPDVSLLDRGTGLNLSHLEFPTRGNHMNLLPLKDVYREIVTPTLHSNKNQQEQLQYAGPIRTTFRGGSVLDYIWIFDSTQTTGEDSNAGTQHSIEIHKSIVFHSEAFQNYRQMWPSKKHPSDHLPVGFEFSWR